MKVIAVGRTIWLQIFRMFKVSFKIFYFHDEREYSISYFHHSSVQLEKLQKEITSQ